MKNPCAYILTNKEHSRFYFGYTTDIKSQMENHSNNHCEDKSWPKECKTLVYYEKYVFEGDAQLYRDAMTKSSLNQIVKWIEKMNPTWKDLPKYWLT